MKPKMALNVLEMAGLVRPVSSKPDVEYAFRHGLLQETAYHTLLRQQRETMHLLVGEAIESSYSERRDELAALLGNHFLQGGDKQRALRYLRVAARNARGRYANTEALEYYTSAIELSHQLGQTIDCAELHRERGATYEIIGDIEAARSDYKQVLSLGRELDQADVIWHGLLDLGKLWLARDYERAGEYFREALDMARGIGDQEVVARSLNRLGNWHLNRGDLDQAKRLHTEALEIFEALENRKGVAETLDLLGMTNVISSDMQAATRYYDRAIDLFRELEEKELLASALTARAMRSGRAQTETAVGVPVEVHQPLREMDEVLELTQELGWKAGESFGRWMRSFLLASIGRLDEAEAYAREGLELAEEIGHAQWTCGSCCALARVLMERLELDAAREHAERSRSLAFETGSRYWIGVASGMLALVCLEANDLDGAEQAVNRVPKVGLQMQGDRLVKMADAELDLAKMDYGTALTTLDELVESAPGFTGEEVIPRLFWGRGRAYLGLGQLNRARQQLELALQSSRDDDLLPMVWRLRGDLAQLEQKKGDENAAQQQLEAAMDTIRTMAENLYQNEDRRHFITQARRRMGLESDSFE